jgi:hypothetical protein
VKRAMRLSGQVPCGRPRAPIAAARSRRS